MNHIIANSGLEIVHKETEVSQPFLYSLYILVTSKSIFCFSSKYQSLIIYSTLFTQGLITNFLHEAALL